jgi:hypothetical protein
LPFELVTQQIFVFGRPHVLLASHLRTGFLQAPGSAVASPPLQHLFRALLVLPVRLAALQSHAADTNARMLSMAARSVHALLHAAPAGPDRTKRA